MLNLCFIADYITRKLSVTFPSSPRAHWAPDFKDRGGKNSVRNTNLRTAYSSIIRNVCDIMKIPNVYCSYGKAGGVRPYLT